jgi:hypothetical protein
MVTLTRGRGRLFHQSGSRTSTPLCSNTGTSFRNWYACWGVQASGHRRTDSPVPNRGDKSLEGRTKYGGRNYHPRKGHAASRQRRKLTRYAHVLKETTEESTAHTEPDSPALSQPAPNCDDGVRGRLCGRSAGENGLAGNAVYRLPVGTGERYRRG